MKRLSSYGVLSLLLLALCLPVQSAWAKANKQTVKFYVQLHCDACVQKVMKNIAFEKGVKDIVCSVEDQTVLVTYDANKTDIPTLQKAFAAINKPATMTPPDQAKSPATPCSGACHSH